MPIREHGQRLVHLASVCFEASVDRELRAGDERSHILPEGCLYALVSCSEVVLRIKDAVGAIYPFEALLYLVADEVATSFVRPSVLLTL